MDDLLYIANHLFLPLRLPQSDDRSTCSEYALVSTVATTCVAYIGSLAGAEENSNATVWSVVKDLLQGMEVIYRDVDGDYCAEDVVHRLAQMQTGDVSAFLVREQNAGIIFRVLQSEVVCEAFEASATNSAVLACESRLVRTFPGPCTSIPRAEFSNPYFRHQLASFISELNHETLHGAAGQAHKAGTTTIEIRESVHPRYITDLLMTILVAMGGESNNFSSPLRPIQKRVADEVLWDHTLAPWRRSPLWTVIRVALQTTLSNGEYKAFLLFLMSTFSRGVLNSDTARFDDTLLDCMRKKLARRLDKLCNLFPGTPSFVLHETQLACEGITSELARRWAFTQAAARPLYDIPWAPLDLDIASDQYLRLANSRNTIVAALHRNKDSSSVETKFTPPSVQRFHRVCLQDILHRRMLHGISTAHDTDEADFRLLDFERAVCEELSSWVVRQHWAPQEALQHLVQTIDDYFTIASKRFAGNAEQQSIMILTILELWVAVDKLAIGDCPLLSSYVPEIPISLLEPLLLRRKGDILRARTLHDYLAKRWTAARGQQSVFSPTSAKAFATSFYDLPGNMHLATSRDQIEKLSTSRRESKAMLVQQRNDEHAQYQTLYNASNHAPTCRRTADTCQKCKTQKILKKMWVEVDEWPLPSKEGDLRMALFEMYCPPSFSYWREATYIILHDMFTPASATPSVEVYEELRDYMTNRVGRIYKPRPATSRLTLASTTKSWKVAHYKSVKIPTKRGDNGCRENGLTWALYDSRTHTLIDSTTMKPDVRWRCTLKLPEDAEPMYKGLQWMVNGVDHSENTVVARQSHASPDLSPHEFVAFGCFRAGGYVQWLNLARAVAALSLSFRSKSVYTLIAQTIQQVGPLENIEDDLTPVWHQSLLSASFSTVLLRSLSSLLEGCRDNWQEVASVWAITTICARIRAVDAMDDRSAQYAHRLLKTCRQVTYSWTRGLVGGLPDVEPEHVAARKQAVREAAAACCLTMDYDDFDPEFEDYTVLLHCLMVLHDNRHSAPDRASDPSQIILQRVHQLAHRNESDLRAAIVNAPLLLHNAVKRVWGAYSPGTKWVPVRGRENWLHSKTSVNAQSVHVNILDGALLVDGKSIGNLPSSVTEHASYIRLFSSAILRAVPAGLDDFDYKTINLVQGHSEIFFALRSGNLYIQARRRDGDTEQRLCYIPQTSFAGDLPTPFVRNYVHWLDLDTAIVELRPVERKWDKSSHIWRIDYPRRRAGRVDKDGHHHHLIAIDSKSYRMLSGRLKAMDDPSFLVVTTQESTIRAHITRLELVFEVDLSAMCPALASKTYPGFVVDETQELGSLIGLESMLLLRPTNTDIGSFPRRLLVPYGQISFDPHNGHVKVYVKNLGLNADTVAHTQFDVNEELGLLVGDGTLRCHFYRILLHALTSGVLPDPLTHRTGTEQALSDLSSAFSTSFQSLGQEELAILARIRDLTPQRSFYPKHIKSMQTIAWSNLPTSSQRAEFVLLVDEITDLNNTLRHLFRGETSIPKHVNDILLLRAVSREAAFPLVNSRTSLANRVTAKDAVYSLKEGLRHFEQNNNGYHFTTAMMMSSLAVCHGAGESGLYSILEELGELVFPESLATPVTFGCDWVTRTDYDETWATFYQWCRAESRSHEAKSLLLFSLATRAYSEEQESPFARLLPYFVLSLQQSQLDLPPLPPWRQYNLGRGRQPSTNTIAVTIRTHARDRHLTPSEALWREEDEDWPEYDARCDAHYNASIRDGSLWLQRECMEQWTRNATFVIAGLAEQYPWSDYFDLERIENDVAQLFESCRWNSDLCEFCERLDSLLQSVPSIPQTLGLDSSLSQFLPSLHRSQSQCPRTILNLLGSAIPQFDMSTSPDLPVLSPTHADTFTSAPEVSTSSLRGVLSSLGTSASSSRVQNVYAQGVIDSLESFEGREISLPFPRPEPDALAAHYSRCQKNRRRCFNQLHSMLCPSSAADTVLLHGGLYPEVDLRALIALLNKDNWCHIRMEWKRALIQLASTTILLQQATRMVQHAALGQTSDLISEVENCGPLDIELVLDHPDWMLIQIESNFRARQLQIDVAREMISPASGMNSTLQLNMGEGKTAVIVPMVTSSLADGNRVVRTVVLKPLAAQMFQLLRDRLSGACDRPIFYLPFSRQLKMGPLQIAQLRELYRTCQRRGGVVVIQPEHILSLKLLPIEAKITSEGQLGTDAVHEEAVLLTHFLDEVKRDILDESDEILHTRYQLIYTMGAQQPLEFAPIRWCIIQDIFRLSINRVKEMAAQRGAHSGIEVQRVTEWRFPSIKFPEQHGPELINKVVDDVMDGHFRGFNMTYLPEPVRIAVRAFITEDSPGAKVMTTVNNGISFHYMQYLLILRGLFVNGLLTHALCHPRWRVDYGLVEETRTLLAVPYRAKDVPAPRSEFGHPDVAIMLTCLAYYYTGLTEAQMDSCLQRLLLDSNPAVLYEDWVADIPLELLPQSIRHVNGINVHDARQRAFIFNLLRYCHRVIDFYLQRIVFPRAMKEFPDKLSSSGWDLAEQMAHPTTGFSGTNDNRYLLPTSIRQVDPVDQSSTNALVLSHLLRPENATYTCTRESLTGTSMSGEHLVDLIGEQRDVRAFLDVGAQMLDLSNEEVATRWLSRRDDTEEVQAAIFFNANDELIVVRRNGDLEPLQSSPYRGRLTNCLVYLDDAHTRGTDLKMPLDWKAAVTLGKKVTKDRLVQGCMRMRQLGKGHSLTFFAPPDVDALIRVTRPEDTKDTITVPDIVRWTMHNTCADIQHHAPQWFQQGMDFDARSSCLRGMSDRPTSAELSRLRTVWLQREARPLQELYGVMRPVTIGSGHQELRARLQELGVSARVCRNIDEEQEREVSHEVEVELQKENGRSKKAAVSSVSPGLLRFVETGSELHLHQATISPLEVIKSVISRHIPGSMRPFNAKFRVTKDFATTIAGKDDGAQFLKDVQWILAGRQTPYLVVISQHEANALMSMLLESSCHVDLYVYAPRINGNGFAFDTFCFDAIRPARSHPRYTPLHDHLTQLNLFSGQLYPTTYEQYKLLCNYLGISTQKGYFAQSDGFVLPKDRTPLPGMQKHCPFDSSPVPFVRALLDVRRKGQDYSLTPMGKMLHGGIVRPSDIARA
ncbi:hypothetical protein CYLTODRAFT_394060 [Cylindrobasidium torrendii FP15055 ss-10]|uniref:ubiquitinyl hydrolase 1 n=1 Tax=Cylindrobasidium torrendii FP15055 ss-10 TaxID=1314674 RepID=A0A0D7BGF9_9AGAR|nr:hypothetical protein CYLTODRAFT_394060 [Cylindrobasidium torrendii FP15055 ss-10]